VWAQGWTMDLDDLKQHFTDIQSHVYSAGEIILYQGELPKNVYILGSGLIKMYSISGGGEERIVDFSVTGEVLASSWVFGNASSTIYYYQALQECVVYEVPRAAFLVYLEKKQAATALFSRLSSQYTASLIRITSLEQARARDKIIYTFYYLLQRFGKEIVPGWYTIQLSLTHQMIADLVGLTRETTAVELNAIKKTKVLSYKRQKYLVHKNRLLKVIGEDTFSNVTF
jgi:CRP/FNR family transcriptional regulator